MSAVNGAGWGSKLVAVACFAVLATFGHAADSITMSADPVFFNGSVAAGIAIDVQNVGPDATGALVVETSYGSTSYPLELPRGAHKRLIAYPVLPTGNQGYMPFADVQCRLQTNRGSIEVRPTASSAPSYGQTTTVLEISDEPGGLQFLAKRPTNTKYPPAPEYDNQQQFSPVYVKPDSAPTRLASYESLGAVLLGPGSERLSDGAVAAIHAYVMHGGRLIFSGGGSATYFRDKRWDDLLPVANASAGTKSVRVPSVDGDYRGALEVQSGPLVPDSVVEKGDVITRMFGLGVVCVLPYSILDGELQVWNGRYAFFGKLVTRPTAEGLAFPDDQAMGSYGGGRYGMYRSGSYGSSVPYGGPSLAENPFNYEPPPVEQVFLLIVSYLVLVVPLNFIVLRRMRKIEWAWVSTPVVSVVFAGIILGLAAKLYLGRLATQTRGALIAVEGEPVGIFSGTAQIFFPSGGVYDLRFKDVDAVHPTNDDYYSSNSSPSIDVGDVGQMVVPNFHAHNLEFTEIALTQYVDVRSWLRIESTRSGGVIDVRVSNLSPYAISGITVGAEGGVGSVARLEPGDSSSVKIPITEAAAALPLNNQSGLSIAIHRPVLTGVVEGLHVGPQPEGGADRDSVSLTFIGSESTAKGANQ